MSTIVGDEEITEAEFIARLAALDARASRRQLRHLKKTGRIRGAEQRHTPGRKGSVSMYLVSEVERVAALLGANVRGRRTLVKASIAAWLARGESALPSGSSSRQFIIESTTGVSQDAQDPRAKELIELIRNPLAPECDLDKADQAYNFLEGILAHTEGRREHHLLSFILHSLVFKDYATLTELDEFRAIGAVFGKLFDPHKDEALFKDDVLRIPAALALVNTARSLAQVSDELLERTRRMVASFCGIFAEFVSIPDRIAKLGLPVEPFAYTLRNLGQTLDKVAGETAPMLVAYVARRASTEPEFLARGEAFVSMVGEHLANLRKTEEIIAANPDLLEKLHEIQTKNPAA